MDESSQVQPGPRWCPNRGWPYLPSDGPDVVKELLNGPPYEVCPCVFCSAGRAREAEEARAAAAGEVVVGYAELAAAVRQDDARAAADAARVAAVRAHKACADAEGGDGAVDAAHTREARPGSRDTARQAGQAAGAGAS
jgi:hypothetical protein